MTTAMKTHTVHHGLEIVPTYRSPVTSRQCQWSLNLERMGLL